MLKTIVPARLEFKDGVRIPLPVVVSPILALMACGIAT
jgi:hypothetical protein